VWPCSVRAPENAAFRAPMRFPEESLTVTFDTVVGARHLVSGWANAFTQAYSDGRSAVSATAEFTPVLQLRPAPGFEGLELVYGDEVDENDVPVAVDDTVTTDEDRAVTVAVAANDADADADPLTVVSVSDPAHGSAAVTGGDGVLYTPDPNVSGPDSFDYVVDDGRGGTATGRVTVTVRPVNDAPVAVPDALTTDQDVRATVAVLANDTDVDGDTLRVAGVTGAAHGTTVSRSDGTVEYTPAAGYVGPDSFTYTVSDGARSATAVVNVTVTRRSVSVRDAAAEEGDFGIRAVRFTVELSSPALRAVTAFYSTRLGTAGLVDFLTTAGIVWIPAGSRTATVTVYVLSDRRAEADEQFRLVLSNASGAQLGRATATGTIVDDD
jgi:hypothetical protein